MNKMMISVLAKDRPRIIANVTSDLYDLGCNLENVNQVIVQNQFARFFLLSSHPKAYLLKPSDRA
ncbi:MAG: hypothetical protein CSA25_06490 [Desulfobacter postgatei]|uniref:ACT domain-containing protein n=1 Tax=Desulfobacter postgatei TaxID=2293 RepID=A0A2G6MPX2_9BACT|nr:MAG: hypothetical protein CSA25_06490 [Desulfobacter postgatei]